MTTSSMTTSSLGFRTEFVDVSTLCDLRPESRVCGATRDGKLRALRALVFVGPHGTTRVCGATMRARNFGFGRRVAAQRQCVHWRVPTKRQE